MSSSNKFVNDNHHLLEMENKDLENQMDLIQEEEFENKSTNDGMEVPSGDDQDQRLNKKKRYHRHTNHQIKELEEFFKECPHPDDKQREELGRRLSLELTQVKFWFQNKRTQMKARHERRDNSTLRSENEKMRAEIAKYKEALENAICPHCGSPPALGEMSFDAQHLSIENNRLREEIKRISGIATKYDGKSMLNDSHFLAGASHLQHLEIGNHNALGIHEDPFKASDLHKPVFQPTIANKSMIIELAVAAMEELIRMAQDGEPLWTSRNHVHIESLNVDKYAQIFLRGTGPRPVGLKSEASRNSTVVKMNHINLVEILMDVHKFSSMFASIISRAVTLEVLSTGEAENYNGALQVMFAEFQVPSPVVPTRENYFMRYCQKYADETWVVVDVSVDNLGSGLDPKRRPSGCLIQKLPNDYSKVTWVEHVESDDRAISNIFKPFIDSGLAFGARRWVETLDRQCERLASLMAKISTGNVGGKTSVLKLAERMMVSFYSGIGASTANTWTKIPSGVDNVRVMTRKSINDRGRPRGIVLSAATSLWLPVTPQRVFDFLRDEKFRSEWDILSNGAHLNKTTHIANGRDPRNVVSLLRITRANPSPSNMLILQESSTTSTGSYVVYAPIDIAAMQDVLRGDDPDNVALLPSGFAILPDGPVGQMAGASRVGTGGTLLTVAFQILIGAVPTAIPSLDSVATVNSLIKSTVERIKATVLAERP